MLNKRIEKLRKYMQSSGVDAYIIPTADYHGSEMVGEYFKCREYITGFTGSAGTAVVTNEKVALWTDGRYFIQAEQQLKDTEIELMRMGEPGTPTITEWLLSELEEYDTVGFDGKTISANEAFAYEEELGIQGIYTEDIDLMTSVWNNRPELSRAEAFCLGEDNAPDPLDTKLSRIREIMDVVGADVHILSSLDDIAWLLNIRGNDVEYSKVVLSYAIVYMDHVDLYVDKKKLNYSIKSKFKDNNIIVHPYSQVYEDIRELPDCSVLIDLNAVNYALYNAIPESCEIIDDDNPSTLMKAIKNERELDNIRYTHIRDGVAVTKLMMWIKERCDNRMLTELDVARKFHSLRAEQQGFIGESFESICAYGEHGAIIHYAATDESNAVITPGTLLLTDTGGHYNTGTTDVSRTIVLGEVSDEIKKDFTAVARGNINLARAKFLYGCHGYNLDVLARQPIWDRGKDYKHGTGHGVGYILNVHEGPSGIRYRAITGDHHLMPGMLLSNEPGIYEEGKYGIRTENLMIVRAAEQNKSGQFLEFETVTMAPIDLDGIIPEEMQEDEREWINSYHKKVYETISPYLTSEETEWLKKYTRKI